VPQDFGEPAVCSKGDLRRRRSSPTQRAVTALPKNPKREEDYAVGRRRAFKLEGSQAHYNQINKRVPQS
jgi:hypothetical protein